MKIKNYDTGVAQDCVRTCLNYLFVEYIDWYIIPFEPLWLIKRKGSDGLFQEAAGNENMRYGKQKFP